VAGVVTSKVVDFTATTFYLQDDTGGIMVWINDSNLATDVGDRIAVTGVVDESHFAYSELVILASYIAPLGMALAPPPVDMTITHTVSEMENIGTLARVCGFVSELNTSDFMISDGIDSVRVYLMLGTEISLAEVALADTFTVVGPLGRDNGEMRLCPRVQSDLVEGPPHSMGPVLLSYDSTNWAPDVNESWTITFEVEADTPPDTLVFRYRYVEQGPEWNVLYATPAKNAEGIYPTEFVGASYGTPSEVEWDFGDGETNTTTMTPICCPIQTFTTGRMDLPEVTERDICDPTAPLPMLGKIVNIKATAVAVESGRVVLEASGSASAKGIYPTEFVGASYGTPSEVEWDFGDGSTNTTTMTPCIEYIVPATVTEFDGHMTLTPLKDGAIYEIGPAALPATDRVPTSILSDDENDGDCAQGKAFENVWVQPLNPIVVDTSEFSTLGIYKVATNGLLADALTVRHSDTLSYQPVVGDALELTGYMDYRDDEYQLVIGSDEYITLTDDAPVGIECLDVGNDQGRFVRLRWYRSRYDAPDSPHVITGYGVYREQDLSKETSLPKGPGEKLDGWDYVMTVPNNGEEIYQCVAPTLCDSTASGICYSTFIVRAYTDDPFTYFDSEEIVGYSIDNLAPAIPGALLLEAGSLLVWDKSMDDDFDYFAVYGSEVDHQDGSEILIGHTIDTSQNVAGYSYSYFMVTASDYAGNESAAAVMGALASVPGPLPTSFALHQCVPNPFNPSTMIDFDLPMPAGVDLRIFDVSGRLVRVLLQGEILETGRRSVVWSGTDGAGRLVHSGTYIYRLQAGNYVETKRMTLLK